MPDTQAQTIQDIIKTKVKKGAMLVSDDYDAYWWLRGHCFHVPVNHSTGQFTNGAFHTNSIEGFWSHLKRMIIGTYFQICRKHLQRYCEELNCEELSYRFNTRKLKDGERFLQSLKHSQGRLTYKRLVQKPVPLDYGKSQEKDPQEGSAS